MTREIKFRAWDKVANKYRGLNGIQDLFSIRSDGHHHEDYIIEQFTGLSDKNGKEIYEGDIVKALSEKGFDHGIHKGEFFKVYFFVENGAWYVSRKYKEEEGMGYLKEIHEYIANCDLEIIGNIHQNHDLL